MSRAQYNLTPNGGFECCHMLEPCWHHRQKCICTPSGKEFECIIHGWAAWQAEKAKSCEHCGGSGILNVEERIDVYSFEQNGPVAAWEPKASACHACPEGELWEGLLDG